MRAPGDNSLRRIVSQFSRGGWLDLSGTQGIYHPDLYQSFIVGSFQIRNFLELNSGPLLLLSYPFFYGCLPTNKRETFLLSFCFAKTCPGNDENTKRNRHVGFLYEKSLTQAPQVFKFIHFFQTKCDANPCPDKQEFRCVARETENDHICLDLNNGMHK